jgi:DNA-binding MarR family transcriptional regulator
MDKKKVDEIRSFNRFYTNIIGLLDRYILHSNYTLPEARILYEIYHREGILAGEIVEVMDIDKGYLSRILLQFEKKKLISKKRSSSDGRSTHISLTAKGQNEFEALNNASHAQIENILTLLSDDDCEQLFYHMSEIKKILSKTSADKDKI